MKTLINQLLRSPRKEERQAAAILSKVLISKKCAEILTVDTTADLLQNSHHLTFKDRMFIKGDYAKLKKVLSMYTKVVFDDGSKFMIVITDERLLRQLTRTKSLNELHSQLIQTKKQLTKEI
ncbi:MAG: hypothetical protein ACKOWO_08015 [Sediminibacterium sp.]